MDKYKAIIDPFPFATAETVAQKTGIIAQKAQAAFSKQTLPFLYSCIDLTSLGTEDSPESLRKWVEDVNRFDDEHSDRPNVAALCVYPNHVQTVRDVLRTEVKVAAVAGGFPSSQTFQEIKVAEVAMAVAAGADEIDVVLNVGEFLDENWQEVVEEIEELKAAARHAPLKVILETGLLGDARKIQTAALLAMHAGADFVKTSTGKVYPGATPDAFAAMCEAVRNYHTACGRRVGVKVSGGVRKAEDAVLYSLIAEELLGKEWLTPDLFRIGASSLAADILHQIDVL
jgi:deoxyribose-phosphate aldolase